MKVKNIMFSGFAAAILMGTANAAGTFQIASKAYVDSRVSSASSAASEVAETVGDLGDLNPDDDAGSVVDGATSVVGALDALDEAVTAKQDRSDSTTGSATYNHIASSSYAVGSNLVALDTALGTAESAIDTLNEQINGDPEDSNDNGLAGDIEDLQDAIGTLPANSNIADLLDGKVDKADAATSIRTVAGGASDDKWATEKAVAAQIEGITGGAGTVDQQIATALGSDFTGQDAYADVTAALADKQDKSDSTVAANDVTAANHLTAGAGVAGNLVALGNALGTVEGTVGNSSAGLVHDVAELQDALNDQTTGLTPRVQALETTVNTATTGLSDRMTAAEGDIDALQTLTNVLASYTTCVTNNANDSGHCALTADENGMSWTFVTDPWIDNSEEPGSGE